MDFWNINAPLALLSARRTIYIISVRKLLFFDILIVQGFRFFSIPPKGQAGRLSASPARWSDY